MDGDKVEVEQDIDEIWTKEEIENLEAKEICTTK